VRADATAAPSLTRGGHAVAGKTLLQEKTERQGAFAMIQKSPFITPPPPAAPFRKGHADDEAPPGTPQTADGICPRCGGSGQVGGSPCPGCDGTGTVTVNVGDA